MIFFTLASLIDEAKGRHWIDCCSNAKWKRNGKRNGTENVKYNIKLITYKGHRKDRTDLHCFNYLYQPGYFKQYIVYF